MSYFIDNLIEQTANELSKNLDELILSRVQAHIPEATAQNLHQYAHRFQIVRRAGMQYPEHYWLDYGKPNAVLILTVHEPVTEMDGDNAKVTQKFSY